MESHQITILLIENARNNTYGQEAVKEKIVSDGDISFGYIYEVE